MIYTYDFQIAGLLFRVSSPYELQDLHELTPFAITAGADKRPDALYDIQLLPESWQIKGEKVAEAAHSVTYQWENQLHRYYYWNLYSQAHFILLTCCKKAPRRHTIYLQANTLDRLLPQFRLAAFLSPELILLQNQAFLLHAAIIDWGGKGILFTGPSGIGKSTQADLWATLEGAEILNGDRAIIRIQDGQFAAWGSPYAGTSGIHSNRSVPISAIVFLSQATENILQPMTGAVAFRQLLRECTALPWVPQFMAQLSDQLLRLIENVPVYHLACTPTEDAVATLKNQLTTI